MSAQDWFTISITNPDKVVIWLTKSFLDENVMASCIYAIINFL